MEVIFVLLDEWIYTGVFIYGEMAKYPWHLRAKKRRTSQDILGCLVKVSVHLVITTGEERKER